MTRSEVDDRMSGSGEIFDTEFRLPFVSQMRARAKKPLQVAQRARLSWELFGSSSVNRSNKHGWSFSTTISSGINRKSEAPTLIYAVVKSITRHCSNGCSPSSVTNNL